MRALAEFLLDLTDQTSLAEFSVVVGSRHDNRRRSAEGDEAVGDRDASGRLDAEGPRPEAGCGPWLHQPGAHRADGAEVSPCPGDSAGSGGRTERLFSNAVSRGSAGL